MLPNDLSIYFFPMQTLGSDTMRREVRCILPPNMLAPADFPMESFSKEIRVIE